MNAEEHKYGIGDKLMIINNGRGVGGQYKGKIVTVSKLGIYKNNKEVGYVLKEHVGNSDPNSEDYYSYKGVIAESMFKLHQKARKGPKKKLNICKK